MKNCKLLARSNRDSLCMELCVLLGLATSVCHAEEVQIHKHASVERTLDFNSAEGRLLICTAAAFNWDRQKPMEAGQQPSNGDSLSFVLANQLIPLPLQSDQVATPERYYLDQEFNVIDGNLDSFAWGNKDLFSYLQPEYIKQILFVANTNEAEGVVVFQCKGHFAGKVKFKANYYPRKGWQVNSFTLPARDIKIVVGEDGRWLQASSVPAQDQAR